MHEGKQGSRVSWGESGEEAGRKQGVIRKKRISGEEREIRKKGRGLAGVSQGSRRRSKRSKWSSGKQWEAEGEQKGSRGLAGRELGGGGGGGGELGGSWGSWGGGSWGELGDSRKNGITGEERDLEETQAGRVSPTWQRSLALPRLGAEPPSPPSRHCACSRSGRSSMSGVQAHQHSSSSPSARDRVPARARQY